MRALLLIAAVILLGVSYFAVKGAHPLAPSQNLAVGIALVLAAIFSLAAADLPGDADD